MSYITDNLDEEVVRLLQGGAVGFMPSDTIYGLSARALDRRAVESLHKLKDRSPGKPFIVLVSSTKMLDMLSIDKHQVRAAEKYWPGPLTFECQAADAPEWLRLNAGYFGVRIPAYPELLGLIDKVGPLVSTSANLEGDPPATSVEQARKIFGEQLDFYVDKGHLEGKASTLVRRSGQQLEVIREGAVKIS